MTEKLWQGRFDQPTNKLVEDYTASIQFDSRLYRYDIEGSIAHCRMLAKCEIISDDEASRIVRDPGGDSADIERGKVPGCVPGRHPMAIEKELIARIGETGGKLHTARSRNDQVALDMRLYMRELLSQCRSELAKVRRALIEMAEKNLDVIMPGFTHLQHAQPVLFAHHLMAYHEMFRRDSARFLDCLGRTNVMPLGARPAGTTSTDMEWTARYLDFPRCPNTWTR